MSVPPGTALHTRPETNNEAMLRDARAEQDIHRIRHEGQLQQSITEKRAAGRESTADVISTTAGTAAAMAAQHGRIKTSRVTQLEEKKEKLEHAEKKYREYINVAWIAFPVTAAVWLLTCTHVCLPELMKEKKRNAQHKINEIDAELIQLTAVNVNTNFSLSDTTSSTHVERRYSGSGDPAPQSVYAPAPQAAVYAPTPAYTTVTASRPPPAYHAHVAGPAIHIQ